MGILDNLESAMIAEDNLSGNWGCAATVAGMVDNSEYPEKAEKTDKCHYCQAIATYNDLAEVDKNSYKIVGVCICHAYSGLSS